MLVASFSGCDPQETNTVSGCCNAILAPLAQASNRCAPSDFDVFLKTRILEMPRSTWIVMTMPLNSVS